jgi:hypothetical protein
MPVIVKNTNTLEFTYQEPTTSADGSSLDDLKETRCYVQPHGGVASVVKLAPASSPNGGGAIDVIAVANVLPGTQQLLDCWVTAVDSAENESAKSNVVQVRIDMLPPAAPLL